MPNHKGVVSAVHPRFGKSREQVTVDEWLKVFRPMTGRQFLGHWQCREDNTRNGLTPNYLKAMKSIFADKHALFQDELRDLQREIECEREIERKRKREEEEPTRGKVVHVELGKGARLAFCIPTAERQVSGEWE